MTELLFTGSNENGQASFVVVAVRLTVANHSQAQGLASLRQAISQWVEETEDGRALWEKTQHTLNIKDALPYLKPHSNLWPMLKRHGIEHLAVSCVVDNRYYIPIERILVGKFNKGGIKL